MKCITSLLSILVLYGISHATPVQWPVAQGGNDHFYEAILKPSGINWEDANEEALAMGGYLATITSLEENTFVFSLVDQNQDFWFIDSYDNGIGPFLGGFQLEGSPEPDGGWQWVTGEPFLYTNWAIDEPNNAGDENRLQFFGYLTLMDSTWNDYPQQALARGFIVEYDDIKCDVNSDGQVTPADALCVFQEYLGIECEHCN